MPLSIVVDEALKVEASLPTNEAISPVEKFVPVIVNVIDSRQLESVQACNLAEGLS